MNILTLAQKIIRFEKGEITEEQELIDFFQALIDNGLNPNTKGKQYAVIAKRLIAEGKITSEPRPQSVSYLFDD